MPYHSSHRLFPCPAQPGGPKSILLAPPLVHGGDRAAFTRLGCHPHGIRSAVVGASPIPRALFDDYLGGRSDRLGRELLFDLRRPDVRRRSIACAQPLATPFTAVGVLAHVRRLRPDLVWLYPGDPARAETVARCVIELGVETIIIEDDPCDPDVHRM